VTAAKLTALLHRRLPGAAVAPRAEAAQPDFDPAPLLALPMVADGSRADFALEMLSLYVETTTRALEKLEPAVAAGRNAEAQRLLHTLKSASGQVGAMALATLAERFEGALRSGGPCDAAWLPALQAAFGRAQRAWAGWRPAGAAR
jgi:HPt (histidine-containing phosphotransfer) domain-containing protein